MKKHFKKTVSTALGLLLPSLIFAQSSKGFMGAVKEIMNDYMLPILLVGMVVAAGAGFLFNLDDFVDKKGEGTRSKALVNIGWIVGISFVSVLALIAIINYIASNQVKI
ncbi:hypothetical protein HCG49_16785 [Arenibacter sp. 6A1]|uniref:hypothetical protein n=1 Tax=Arenibacter sp. 6A1 TaxID=2720391 RepID=UPI0014480FAD|nr:hypothetical protein [Arenibacter sp. 6A1]NKI28211.1 hypothetical protein [Arenibacter sp. 6A1]